MQSISLSSASRNLGCNHSRFWSRSSLVRVGKNCITSKNGPSCSMTRWMVALPISILADKMGLPLRVSSSLVTAARHVRMLQAERQIALPGFCFQHDRSARERIDSIGERERLLDQLLDQQYRGPILAQPLHHHPPAIHQ